jgi:myo-inositol-1(or 4)-monophosphatase
VDDLGIARAAALAAATVIRDHAERPRHADLKGVVDPVTAADREAEQAIVETIRAHHPDDGILAEEGSASESATGRRWVIDPLDGTVNFVRGIPQVAVSIALEDVEGTAVGVVRDVFRDEEFSALRSEGAFLSGHSIRPSATTDLGDAVVSTGFPYDRREKAADYGRHVGAVLARVRGIRRMGSAAIDLAWVACGRLDGHWEVRLSPWDVAAGILLVREAGGVVTAPDGGAPSHHALVAATPGIHEALRLVVAEALGS